MGSLRPPRTPLPFLAVVAGLTTLLVGCSSAPAAAPSPYTQSELATVDPGTSLKPQPAPDFTLTDQFGQPVSLHSLKGKVVILAFTDSQCTTICPLTTESLVQALNLLGPAASKVQLLGIDANPDAISVSDVATFTAAHGMQNRWLFLTGDLPTLKKVWGNYGVAVEILKGAIDHTPAIYLIDQKGQERKVYLASPDYGVVSLEALTYARDIAALLPPGTAKVETGSTPAGPPPLSSTSKVSLPTLTGQTQKLGFGPAHLVAFFASWIPDPTAFLQSLSTYQASAGTSGLPSVVAIDVATTEPSPNALKGSLASLGALALPYPVAIDGTGRVADAYNVQDLPWLALVSAKGKIIWSHDGSISASDLQAAVTKAVSSATP